MSGVIPEDDSTRVSRGAPDHGRVAGCTDVWIVCRCGPEPARDGVRRMLVAICEHGTPVARVTSTCDRRALEALRAEHPDETFACEPSLSKTADELGLPILPIDGARLCELARMNLVSAACPALREDELDHDVLRFVRAAVRFERERCHEDREILFRSFELTARGRKSTERWRVCVSREADGPHVLLGDVDAGLAPEGLRLGALFVPPMFGAEVIRRGLGVEHACLPVRFHRRDRTVSRRDLDVLTAALECLVSWTGDMPARTRCLGTDFDLTSEPASSVLAPGCIPERHATA